MISDGETTFSSDPINSSNGAVSNSDQRQTIMANPHNTTESPQRKRRRVTTTNNDGETSGMMLSTERNLGVGGNTSVEENIHVKNESRNIPLHANSGRDSDNASDVFLDVDETTNTIEDIHVDPINRYNYQSNNDQPNPTNGSASSNVLEGNNSIIEPSITNAVDSGVTNRKGNTLSEGVMISSEDVPLQMLFRGKSPEIVIGSSDKDKDIPSTDCDIIEIGSNDDEQEIDEEEEESQEEEEEGQENFLKKPGQPPLKRLRDFTCPICFEESEQVIATPCGHIYCRDCVFKAVSSVERATPAYGECSMCRKKLKYQSLVYLTFRKAGS